MHYPSLLAVILTATSTLVAAAPVPMDYAYEVPPSRYDRESRKGHARIDDAMVEANRQIGYMDETLTAARANRRGPEAQIVKQAFGRQAFKPENIDKIQDTVNRMSSNAPANRLRLHSSRPDMDEAEFLRLERAKRQDYINSKPAAIRPTLQASIGPQTIQPQRLNGMTEVQHDWATGQQTTGKVMLGSKFHASKEGQSKAYRTEYRAGALIHEYAHQHAYASDDAIVDRHGRVGRVTPINNGPVSLRPGSRKKVSAGYANTSSRPIRSEDDLKDSYKQMRDTSPNMAWNADSYRVFGGLCTPHRLLKRALLEEDPVSYYLAKRQACQLGPDYFKKKAEEKAAAAAKAKEGATAVSPADKKAPVAAKSGSTAAMGGKAVKGSRARKAAKPTRIGRTSKSRTTRRGKVAKTRAQKKPTSRKSTGVKGATRRAGKAKSKKTHAVRAKKTRGSKRPAAHKASMAPKPNVAAAPKRKVAKKGGKVRRGLLDDLE